MAEPDRELIEGNENTQPKPGRRRNKPKEDEGKGSCSCHAAFFISVEGVLKIVEFFSTMIAWAFCADSYRHLNASLVSRYGYFLFVGITCWIIIICIIFFHLIGLYNLWINNRLNRLFGWYIHLLAFAAIYCFFWCVGSILLAMDYEAWEGNAAAAFFGFVTLVLFIVDAVMYYRVCRKYRKEIRAIRRGYFADPDDV